VQEFSEYMNKEKGTDIDNYNLEELHKLVSGFIKQGPIKITSNNIEDINSNSNEDQLYDSQDNSETEISPKVSNKTKKVFLSNDEVK